MTGIISIRLENCYVVILCNARSSQLCYEEN